MPIYRYVDLQLLDIEKLDSLMKDSRKPEFLI